MGNSREILKTFSEEVRDEIGFALFTAQQGEKHPNAHTFKQAGSGVFEIIARDQGGTYRCFYIAKLSRGVYVLHCFQKKARKGIATSQGDVELVQRRLAEALGVDSS